MFGRSPGFFQVPGMEGEGAGIFRKRVLETSGGRTTTGVGSNTRGGPVKSLSETPKTSF